MFARMQRLEIGYTIDAEHDRLAIDHELLRLDLQRGLGDPGKALRPLIAVPADQAHAHAITHDHHAVAIVLYFVKPIRTGGNLRAARRKAELECLSHAGKIGARPKIANPGVKRAAPTAGQCRRGRHRLEGFCTKRLTTIRRRLSKRAHSEH
jgi:hypothetical protein